MVAVTWDYVVIHEKRNEETSWTIIRSADSSEDAVGRSGYRPTDDRESIQVIRIIKDTTPDLFRAEIIEPAFKWVAP